MWYHCFVSIIFQRYLVLSIFFVPQNLLLYDKQRTEFEFLNMCICNCDCVSYCSNAEMKTVIHNCVCIILLPHVSAFVESHHQACKTFIKKDYLYATHKNGT